MNPDGIIKISFFGDSYTCASGLEPGAEQLAFPHQLLIKLAANGIATEQPEIIAEDGNTSVHLLGALEVLRPESSHRETTRQKHGVSEELGDCDLVILSIGINDIFDGLDIRNYRKFLFL